MFECVDARTDGRTPARVPSYKLTLCSGELTIQCLKILCLVGHLNLFKLSSALINPRLELSVVCL